MTLHFIGCLHNDPDGEMRIQIALDQLNPRAITLEYRGNEAQALRDRPEFIGAMAHYHDLARAVLREYGFSSQAYDEANRAYDAWFGEVRGTLGWAARNCVPVYATEDPTQQMEWDRKLIENPVEAVAGFEEWIRGLASSERDYNPFSRLPTDLQAYQLLEKHLAGQSDEQIVGWVDNAKKEGILNPMRLRYQMRVMKDALASVGVDFDIVHVGGAVHVVDAGTLEPPTLYQQVRREFPGLNLARYSLNSFR